MRPAAYAMESVAEPFPALASTTSVPAFWILSVSASASAGVNVTLGVTCTARHVQLFYNRKGKMELEPLKTKHAHAMSNFCIATEHE